MGEEPDKWGDESRKNGWNRVNRPVETASGFEFADLIRSTPGRTNVAVHTIETNGPPTRWTISFDIDCCIAIGIQ